MMTVQQVKEAVRDRLIRNAYYLDSMADAYVQAIDRKPRHADKIRVAKMRTLATLTREIAVEVSR